MNARISPLKRLAVAVGIACIGAAAATAAAAAAVDEPQYSGRVAVTADGNGIASARFPTTVGGEDVTYYLNVQNGCGARSTPPRAPCPPPVKALSVTLNGEVVFQRASAFTVDSTEIALNLVGTSDNEIMVTVDGERGAAARFTVIARRPHAE